MPSAHYKKTLGGIMPIARAFWRVA